MEEMPPGFRFYPTEEELVSFYLHKQLQGKRKEFERLIPTVDIYDLEPWHLPKLCGELCRADTEQWFFFTERQEREARGGRPSRTTTSGYWKATGSPGYVYSSDNRVVGVKKTMVFYKGKAPNGRKTKWKMNEYRAIQEANTSPFGCVVPKLRHEMSLCRVYVISGSFRAFDRRPLGAGARESICPKGDGDGDGAMTQNSQVKQTELETSSPDSYFSGGGGEDHFELSQEMVNCQEPLWEWEQLNWL